MKKWIVTFLKKYFDVNFVLNFKNQRKMGLSTIVCAVCEPKKICPNNKSSTVLEVVLVLLVLFSK